MLIGFSKEKINTIFKFFDNYKVINEESLLNILFILMTLFLLKLDKFIKNKIIKHIIHINNIISIKT